MTRTAKGTFAKGTSGNPSTQFKKGPDPRRGAGRAYKFESLDYWLDRDLGEQVEDGPYKGMTYGEAITRICRQGALEGDFDAIKFVFERTCGKPTQRVEGDVNNELIINVRRYVGKSKRTDDGESE
ncbi:MAG TPA: hypothetical protein PLL10_00160 [Elusimicrobiales bacterium]|nr:hypothetical protein [Elusimicrobiales bacterium]